MFQKIKQWIMQFVSVEKSTLQDKACARLDALKPELAELIRKNVDPDQAAATVVDAIKKFVRSL